MRFLCVAIAFALLAGCGPTAQQSTSGASETAGGACADGGARLAGTGLCQSEANALLGRDPDVRTPELEDCTWSVKELMLPGDEALLYRAAACGGVETTLAYAGGARRAEISYESSAVYGAAASGRVVIALYGTDPDPQGALKAAIAELPAGDRAACEIVPAQREGWPTDALLIAPNAAARARLPAGQPVIACGPLGINETELSYWRVRQGFAWFFDLGDRDPDFDAGNMGVFTRSDDGAWRPKA
ncbi:MAG: hypothetical protein AB7O04_00390 [Hyphomonadaceae bacterium]